MQNEILELTKKLIMFKTITGNNKEIADCFDFIKSYFDLEIKTGKIIAKEYEKNGVLSLVLANSDCLVCDILLNGHIDVVAAEDEKFIPFEKNGKLYARGAADMKSQVVAMMIALKELANNKTKKSIALILNSDEEIGGESGVKYLVNEVGYKAKIVIAPDGGNNFELDIKEKGCLWFKIIALGKAAHGSRPWLGENAIQKLIKFYRKLEVSFPQLKKTNLLYQDGISVNLGKIQGGTDVNIVSDKAEMQLDIRYSERKDRETIIGEIKKLTEEFNLFFEIIDDAEVFEVNPDDRYVKCFKVIAEKIIGRKTKIIKSTGSGDNRFFSAKGMPVIIMGPNFGGEHGVDEWVEIKSLEKFYQILKEFVCCLQDTKKRGKIKLVNNHFI